MYLLIRFIVLSLFTLGCSAQSVVSEQYRFWRYGFTVPPYFQMKMEYLQASMPDGHIITLMTGGSLGGGRPDNGLGYEMSPGFSSSMYQNRYIELPDSMVISWFSYAEKQFYAANIHLSADNKKQMMQPYLSDCQGRKQMAYHNTIVIGLAPGGYVKVWGKGGCFNQAIPVGKFKGWKMSESITGTKPEQLKESTEEYHQKFADILAKPIPYEKWQ